MGHSQNMEELRKSVRTASYATERELAASLAIEGDVSKLHHVEEVLVPHLHLDDSFKVGALVMSALLVLAFSIDSKI